MKRKPKYPPLIYICKEIRAVGDDETRTMHRIVIPNVCDPGGYTQTMTLNAFAYGTNNRGCRGRKGVLYYMIRENEWLADMERQTKWFTERGYDFWVDERTLPITEHDGMWAFYKAIGYDHKTKKYAPEPENNLT